jgi:hypothetical protein
MTGALSRGGSPTQAANVSCQADTGLMTEQPQTVRRGMEYVALETQGERGGKRSKEPGIHDGCARFYFLRVF